MTWFKTVGLKGLSVVLPEAPRGQRKEEKCIMYYWFTRLVKFKKFKVVREVREIRQVQEEVSRKSSNLDTFKEGNADSEVKDSDRRQTCSTIFQSLDRAASGNYFILRSQKQKGTK